MQKLFKQYTGGNPELMMAPTLWAFIENASSIAPSVLVMLAMGELVSAFTPSYEVHIETLWRYCLWLGAALLIQTVISLLSYRYSYYASQKAMGQMRLSLVEKMRRLPLGIYSERESGDFVNAFVTDPDKLDQSMSFFIPQIISMGLLSVLSAVMLFAYDWRLALPMYIMLPVGLLLMRIAMKLRYRQAGEVSGARIHATTLLNEYLLGMRNLKSYNQTGEGFSRLDSAYEALRRETTKEEGMPGAITLLSAHIVNFGIPLIIFTGTMLLVAGRVDIRILLAYLILSTKLYTPLSTAIICGINLRSASVPAERINGLLEEKVQEGSKSQMALGDISFENVSFSYGGNQEYVLNHISLQAKQNQLTAVVGPSGCGKSTLFRLIARFWDPQRGSIYIGNTPLREIKPEVLFANISMVFQDNYLFGDSIRNNILFGRSDKGEADMIDAAKRACCHDFISALPQGYDTVIGEGGGNLSGGERQRIAIARAILKDAPILLLDEPTSSLDAESEAMVQKAIEELIRGKTVFMIAHRLKTVATAHQIIVLEEGRVLQKGGHQALLDQKEGLYRHLWDLQEQAQAWNIKN